MVTLTEALAAERARIQQTVADTLTRQQIGQAVLEALAQRLTAEPLPGWAFVLTGQEIRVFRTDAGTSQQVGRWTVDEQMRLVAGDQMTEWITAESWARVVDEAVQITTMLIADAETGAAKPSIGIVELPPRF